MMMKDYFRLAKISLAARKKTTKSTVRGIAFGLILLIPVLFIALGVFGDLNYKINKNPEVLYAKLTAAAEQTGLADSKRTEAWYNDYTISFDTAANIYGKIKTDDKIMYEQVRANLNIHLLTEKDKQTGYYGDMNNEKAFDFTLDGQEESIYIDVALKNQYSNSYYSDDEGFSYSKSSYDVPFAAILDLKNSGRTDFAPKKMTDKLGGIFVAGMDKGFTDGGKGEVIISEKFITALGKTNADFYQKEFTIGYLDSGEIYLNNENTVTEEYKDYSERGAYVPQEHHFFNQFKVVGIIKAAVTEAAMKIGVESNGVPAHYMANMLFLTTDSLLYGERAALDPVVTNIVQEQDENNYSDRYKLATYEEPDVAELNRQYICLGANNFSAKPGSSGYYYGRADSQYSEITIFADPPSYAGLKSIGSLFIAELEGIIGEESGSYITYLYLSRIYSEVDMWYTIFTYMILFLSVIGGIIFFAAMVNLFNSIVHSVDSRKGYLGVLRAVGGKRSLINKMYFAESVTIFLKSVIWIVAFAGVICIGIKLLLDMALSYVNMMMPFTLGIAWWYIPVAIGIGLAALLLLGFLFSYGCSSKVSRAKITETLAAQ